MEKNPVQDQKPFKSFIHRIICSQNLTKIFKQGFSQFNAHIIRTQMLSFISELFGPLLHMKLHNTQVHTKANLVQNKERGLPDL